jgi:hypothetical protein
VNHGFGRTLRLEKPHEPTLSSANKGGHYSVRPEIYSVRHWTACSHQKVYHATRDLVSYLEYFLFLDNNHKGCGQACLTRWIFGLTKSCCPRITPLVRVKWATHSDIYEYKRTTAHSSALPIMNSMLSGWRRPTGVSRNREHTSSGLECSRDVQRRF